MNATKVFAYFSGSTGPPDLKPVAKASFGKDISEQSSAEHQLLPLPY